MVEGKKSRVLPALLLSLLTALAGGAVFGLIYGLGYYVYLLAAAEISLAVSVFLKFMKKANGKTITLSIVWCVLWTFIFNILSVVICESIWVAKEVGCSIFDAYKVVLELWKTDAEVQSYMNTRVLQIACMILIGGIVYGISALVSAKKMKRETANNSQQAQKSIPATKTINRESNISDEIVHKAKEVYIAAFNELKEALEKFESDKNEETLNKKKFLVKERYISNIDENVREHLIVIVNKFLAKEELSKIDRAVNLNIIKMLNS